MTPSKQLTPKEFVTFFKPFAIECMNETGLHYHASLTQGALESGWNKQSPMWNLFGVKWSKGDKQERQLLTTTEVLKSGNVKFPEIISITPKNGLFYYVVKDWFRAYCTPKDSFTDHANFFQQNSRYQKAWLVRSNAEQFLREVAKAGYATDPLYEKKCIDTLRWFEKSC